MLFVDLASAPCPAGDLLASCFSPRADRPGAFIFPAVVALHHHALTSSQHYLRGRLVWLRELFFHVTTKRRLGKRLHAWIPANRADWSHSEKMEPKKLASPAPAFVLVGLVPKCPSVLMASGGEAERRRGPRRRGKRGHSSDGEANRGHDCDDEVGRRTGIDGEATARRAATAA